MIVIPLHILLPTLFGSILAGVLCSTMGVFVVRLKLAPLGFAMSHAAFAGAALGLAVPVLDPLWMALVFAVVMAFLLGPLADVSRLNMDAVVGAFFPLMMALGLIFLSLAPSSGIGRGALSLLWGSVLGITFSDVIKLAGLAAFLVVLLIALGKGFLAILLDRRLAIASGINARLHHHAILFLTAITVALALQITGGLLVYALMILPASAAFQLVYDIKKIFLLAPALGALAAILGLLLSLGADLPIGSSITVAAAGVFLLAVILSPKRLRRRLREIA